VRVPREPAHEPSTSHLISGVSLRSTRTYWR
jgi:hypothetical protein